MYMNQMNRKSTHYPLPAPGRSDCTEQRREAGRVSGNGPAPRVLVDKKVWNSTLGSESQE
ncbi:UNVERIFIED_CONTAM: hypothetical protein NCL1_17489 [Trichonephila clavipes]